jgi:hypothetical protein
VRTDDDAPSSQHNTRGKGRCDTLDSRRLKKPAAEHSSHEQGAGRCALLLTEKFPTTYRKLAWREMRRGRPRVAAVVTRGRERMVDGKALRTRWIARRRREYLRSAPCSAKR